MSAPKLTATAGGVAPTCLVHEFTLHATGTLAEYDEVMAERDVVEQMVADGELCSEDGQPCEPMGGYYWDEERVCRKCGEPT